MERQKHKRFTAKQAALILMQDRSNDDLSEISWRIDDNGSDDVETDSEDNSSENLIDIQLYQIHLWKLTTILATTSFPLIFHLKMREKDVINDATSDIKTVKINFTL